LPCNSETIPKPKKSDSVFLNDIKDDPFYKSYMLEKIVDKYKFQISQLEPDPQKKQMIENFQIIILCSTGSPFCFIYNTIKNNYNINDPLNKIKINMFFLVGRDRADFFDKVLDYFKNKSYINSVNGVILEREGMESLKNSGLGNQSILDIKSSEYSASFIRNLVNQDKKDEFFQVYRPYLDSYEIDKLFNTIKIGIQMSSPSSKNEPEDPRSKYFDNIGSLPIINTTSEEQKSEQDLCEGESSGGYKKMKKTKRKKSKKQKKTKRRKKGL
jgi:hypothetical protein